MLNTSNLEIKVTKKVKEVLEMYDKEIEIEENLSLIGLDSMRSVALIVELEADFDILFDDEEMLFENFSTIKKITELISSKPMIV